MLIGSPPCAGRQSIAVGAEMTAPLRQSETSTRLMPNLKRSAAPPSPQQRYSCAFVPITPKLYPPGAFCLTVQGWHLRAARCIENPAEASSLSFRGVANLEKPLEVAGVCETLNPI